MLAVGYWTAFCLGLWESQAKKSPQGRIAVVLY
jgi:hypothetical protein